MTTFPAPPATLDEIPAQCAAAWQALGADLSEAFQTSMRKAWERNEFGVFVHYLREIRDDVPPAERMPGWRDAFMALLQAHPEAYARRGAFLVDACVHLLSARDVLSIPGNVAAIGKTSWPQAWMRGFMPRSREEREGLVALVRESADVAVQASALDLLVRRRDYREESVEDKAHRHAQIEEALRHIDDEALRGFVVANADFGGFSANDLMRHVESPALLVEFAERGGLSLRRAALERITDALRDVDTIPDALIDRLEALLLADQVSFRKSCVQVPHVGLCEFAWQHAEDDKMRAHVLRWTATLLEDERFGAFGPSHPALPLLWTIIGSAPDIVRAWFWNSDAYRPHAEIDIALFETLWQARTPALLDLFLPWIASWQSSWQPDAALRRATPTLQEILAERRADLASVKPTQVVELLARIDGEALFDTLDPQLQDLAAKSKPIQRALPQHLARFGSTRLQRLGWLADKRKATRETGLEALLLCNDADAATVLQSVRDDKRTTDTDRDRIDARLGRSTRADHTATAGPAAATPEPGAADLDALKTRVAKAKIKPVVDKVWNERLAAALTPLPPEFGRWLLSLAVETKEDRLTGTALGLIAHLSRERRAALAELLFELWLAANGDRKLIWLLLFMAPCGDDRLLEPLSTAFKSWHKRAKPKAVTVLKTMASLDTAYALSHVYEVYSKATYSYAIRIGAKEALQAAAARRGCTLADLADEITPDFGLTAQGRVFDFGTVQYTMQVGTDLDLRFTHHGTGKTAKTLPKAKDGEDADARAEADAAIKVLRGGLKKVVKLQAQRLEDAMVIERSWPAARWRVLFVDHAVLGLIGQGLVWTRLDADGEARGSFRISEDRSLIDAADQPVTLADDERVRLWHPSLASAGEVQAWTAHLADYEVKPFLEQVRRPVVQLSAEQADGHSFGPHATVKVAQSTIKYGLEGWNYQISDQDGSHIFGFSRRFGDGLRVLIDTEDMDASLYGDSALGSANFYRGDDMLALRDVPAPLLSLVAEHFDKLAAKAVR
ncbi:MAG: DUF4132 domain-containing protein [Xanthomonadaceae bacterium]|nr:DUF4132 domain-containing protein [Xanthomonadaceae bacterium]